VALDVFPHAPKAKPRQDAPMLEIPTIATSLGELQSTIASIATKLDSFPLEQVGKDLSQTLRNATRMTDAVTHLMQRVDAEIAPEARAALVEARKAIASAERAVKPDSPLSQDAREAMQEIQRAAAAVRVLADYLERHPEALLRGKKEPGSPAKKDDK